LQESVGYGEMVAAAALPCRGCQCQEGRQAGGQSLGRILHLSPLHHRSAGEAQIWVCKVEEKSSITFPFSLSPGFLNFLREKFSPFFYGKFQKKQQNTFLFLRFFSENSFSFFYLHLVGMVQIYMGRSPAFWMALFGRLRHGRISQIGGENQRLRYSTSFVLFNNFQ